MRAAIGPMKVRLVNVFEPDTNNPFGSVVGVVGDIRNIDPQHDALPAFYFPYGYIGMPGSRCYRAHYRSTRDSLQKRFARK